MKTFEQIWKDAKDSGNDIKTLAEDFHKRYADKINEGDMQTIIGILQSIDGYFTYLSEEKIEHADLNKVKIMLKTHSHLLDKIVIPLE